MTTPPPPPGGGPGQPPFPPAGANPGGAPYPPQDGSRPPYPPPPSGSGSQGYGQPGPGVSYGQPPTPQGGAGYPYGQSPQGQGSSGGNDTPKMLGIGSTIGGAFGIFLGCCCWPLGFILGIGTLVAAGIGYSRVKDDPATESSTKTLLIIGLALGVITIVMSIIGVFIGIANFATNPNF